jgi:hypothetical protein
VSKSKSRYNRGAWKYPDKRSIISEIWRRYAEGLPLNYSAIRTDDDSLRRRSTALFGGWRYAVEAAGFNYDDVRVDTDMASYYGYKLEMLFGELLTELRVEFEQYAHSRFNPDYVLTHGRWIDVKLSEWTISNDDYETITRYEPYCRSLTIVFLRGRDIDRMITRKTRLINIRRYVKQLPRHKRGYFYARLNAIENELKEALATKAGA